MWILFEYEMLDEGRGVGEGCDGTDIQRVPYIDVSDKQELLVAWVVAQVQ